MKVGLVRPIHSGLSGSRRVQMAAQDAVVGLLSGNVRRADGGGRGLAVNGVKPVDFMGKLGASLPTTEEIVEKILQVRKERG